MTDTIATWNPLEHVDWDTYLPARGRDLFFCTRAWAQVLADTYRYEPAYLGARDGGKFTALLPLMDVRSRLTGHRGVALPFTDSCEPVALDEETARQTVDAAIRLGRDRKWKYVEFRSASGVPSGTKPSLTFYGHVVGLNSSPDLLLETFDGSVRTAIRKAEGAGLRIDMEGSRRHMAQFYDLNSRTRREHGLPPQPFAFFDNLRRHVIEMGKGLLILALHGNRPVAGAVFLHFGDSAIYKFGASDRRFQDLRANNLVMWTALRRFGEAGFPALSLGKTALHHEGLRRFKLGWGPREEILPYHKYDYAAARFVEDRDLVSGFHTRVFRHLPRPAARLAGTLLYRHMA